MNRLIIIALGSMAAVSGGLIAQSNDAAIEKALLAAPRQMKEGATVIAWKADNTYDTLRKGTNHIVCYDRSGAPAQPAFAIQCTSIANLDRVAQNRKFETIADRRERQAAIDAAEKDGSRMKPEYGSVWYDLSGPDAEHTHMHITIAMPGATSQSVGLPDNNKQGGAWLMNAGTSSAHIMTPGS